ncbi:MAG TPA: SGNH/GDSL hydrolase family protein [Pyrinomonadaceae bacterium]
MIRVLFVVIVLSLATAGQTAPYTREKDWEKEINALVEIDLRQTPPHNAVLFVGSSSIRMWQSLRADFPGVNVINRGFGGSHLEDLVFFAPKIVFPYRPKKIVVYSGENDIEAGQSAENVLEDFKAFIDLRDANLPGTPVIYISLKPSILRWGKWPEMARANALIAAEVKRRKRVTFVDVAAKMLGTDGKPLPDIFVSDNLHLNAKGYAIFREAVAAHVK